MKLWRIGLGALVLALAGGAAVFGLSDLSPAPERIPTTRPVRGDMEVRVHTLGELGPRRAMALAAPSVGGMLQIVTLAPAGTLVAEGDVILEFDPAEQRFNLQQAESELAEAEQEIVKLLADAQVQAAQDQLDLLHARHELRRAEIDVSGNEFVGRIEAQKNDLKLEETRRSLAQIEGDIRTHAEGHKAALAVLEEKRSKARIAADFARRNIENMVLRAPLDGLVVLKENQDAAGGFGFPGMSLPEYREGDTVQPGRTVAEIVDLSEMEIKTRILETDRASVASGAMARVEVDALPGAALTGASKGVGGLAQNAFWEPQTARQFDAAFALAQPSTVLRPGMTARLVVEGGTLENVIHLPRQALFEREGKSVVYVRESGDRFRPVEVKVDRLTESRVILTDFDPDAEVALTNPETARRGGSSSPASPTLPGGGV